ncbi:hypothetical protein [Streptomyces sp. SID13031]|uniref:alpha/beta hydrolase family protein n=1 Tax=Streptomyces sp. SID13031 TaxID=2706046 RepID=UPI0013CC3605|nr:hypothetical protein [Streptomyces sp. SID13031]NEA30576.1 hypothetical protein [Streptomyces sp. SID13031]
MLSSWTPAGSYRERYPSRTREIDGVTVRVAAPPEGVGGIYLDNAVCDLRSWPGGLGRGKGAPAEWRQLLDIYGLDATDLDGVAAVSPISKLAPLAAARIPLLVAYGDADHAVPADENSEPLLAKYTELGGPSEAVVRPGADHHPHGIAPALVQAFFEKTITPDGR